MCRHNFLIMTIILQYLLILHLAACFDWAWYDLLKFIILNLENLKIRPGLVLLVLLFKLVFAPPHLILGSGGICNIGTYFGLEVVGLYLKLHLIFFIIMIGNWCCDFIGNLLLVCGVHLTTLYISWFFWFLGHLAFTWVLKFMTLTLEGHFVVLVIIHKRSHKYWISGSSCGIFFFI